MKCTKIITNTNDVIYDFIKKNVTKCLKTWVMSIIRFVYNILYFKITTPKIIPSKARSPDTKY
jgi:hypothetical protein